MMETPPRVGPTRDNDIQLEPSPSLCNSCTQLLQSPLSTEVLLWDSFVPLYQSSITCKLCQIICSKILPKIHAQSEFIARSRGCRLYNQLISPNGNAHVWGMRRITSFMGMYTTSTLDIALSVEPPVFDVNSWSSTEHGSIWALRTNESDEQLDCMYGTELRNPGGNLGVHILDAGSLRASKEPPAACHRAKFTVFSLPGISSHESLIWLYPLTERVAHLSSTTEIFEEAATSISTGSAARMKLAGEWLQSCMSAHQDCKAWQNKSVPLPSRVLDVGPADGSASPYLYCSSDEANNYVCLSHRWGGAKVLTTTSATLEERQNGILMESLPKTFYDAVLVTRSLGYRYLWIDSLCILQDKMDDWEAEASKMAQIYRYATVTIVAAAATSADSGCFQELEQSSSTASANAPCKIGTLRCLRSCSTHDAHTFDVFASPSRRMKTDAGNDSFKPMSTLDSRGWVLQEELLSARSLIFASDGIYWECMDLTASESFPSGTDSTQSSTLYPGIGGAVFNPTRASYARQFKMEIMQRSSKDGNDSLRWPLLLEESHDLRDAAQGRLWVGLTDPVIELWSEIVRNFSGRDLTKESDRLVAIQGAISSIQEVRDDVNCAGLWKSYLPQQMTWHVFEVEWEVETSCDCVSADEAQWYTKIRPRRPVQNVSIAPSWSWASVNQKVVYGQPDMHELFIRVIDVDMTNSTTHIMGRITLQGVLCPVRVLVQLNKQENPEDYRYNGIICDPADRTSKPLTFFYGDHEREINAVAMCLPIGASLKGIRCLILEPTANCRLRTPSSRSLEFRRIGYAEFGTHYKSFLGLGSADTELGPQRKGRDWTRKVFDLELI